MADDDDREQKAQEREDAIKALNLHLAGVDWDTIADRLGYDDPADACMAAEEVAAEEYEGPVTNDPARMFAVLRLNRLGTVAWRAAMAGDMNAVRMSLEIGDRRDRLMRLNQRSRD